MSLSARNQFAGKIASVKEGAVNGIVTLDVNGTPITATISMNAINDLGLKEGVEASAVIKATEVMVGQGAMRLSARNQFAGKVTAVKPGAVNSIVAIDTPSFPVTATITNAAVEDLGLTVGCDATAIVKATSVMIARQ